MTAEKRILVIHDTESLAKRARRPAPGETIGYVALKDYDETQASKFDEVLNLSTVVKELAAAKVKK